MLASDVIEGNIRGLGADRIPEEARLFLFDEPPNGSVAHDADTAGISYQDWVSKTPLSSIQ